MGSFEDFQFFFSEYTPLIDDNLVGLEDCEVDDEEDVADHNSRENILKPVADVVGEVEPLLVLDHQHGARDADHDLE